MVRNRTSVTAAFIVQAASIMAALFALAGLGLWSLRQDRLWADQEARQRAEEWVARVCERMETRGAAALSALDAAPDPTDRATFDQAGALLSPPELVPAEPPAWILECAPDWLEAWERIQRDGTLAGGVIDSPGAMVDRAEALRELAARTTNAHAQANAQFALLRLETAAVDTAQAARLLAEFGLRHEMVCAESGLPLDALALGLALERAGSAAAPGLSASALELMRQQVTRSPCAITPRLLELAERVSGGTGKPAATVANADAASTRAALAGLRRRLRADERVRFLARPLQDRREPVNPRPSCRWIDGSEGRWLASIRPGAMSEPVPADDRSQAGVVAATEARFHSKAAVEAALASALTDASPPSYFQLRVELADEPLALALTPAASAPGSQAGRVLAERAGALGLAGGKTEPAGAEPAVASEQQVHARGASLGYRVRLVLGDADRFHARSRQRRWLFGALIATAGLVATGGLVASYRSLRRQIALNELKSNFVSSVSHELRAPIASIRLLAEGLERGRVSASEKQREYYGFIVQECRRLSALIENVLDFARIEQGRKDYEFEPTDLGRLVRETVRLMEPVAAEKQVSLELDPAASAVSCGPPESDLQPSAFILHPSLDGRAIQQALLNLIDNAVKFSPAGGTVTVGLRLSDPGLGGGETGAGGMGADALGGIGPSAGVVAAGQSALPVIIWVQDQGPGIPPEDQERIFERFYRRGSELRRDTQGVGIGLSLVRHIVEAHGGRVTLRSAVGHGSRFELQLPIRPAQPATRT
jgi:signal transduction histidine kinase